MEECLNIIGEGTETQMDIILAAQIKCQIIKNRLSCSPTGERGEQSNTSGPSEDLITALLQQVIEIQQNLPHQIQSQGKSSSIFRSG